MAHKIFMALSILYSINTYAMGQEEDLARIEEIEALFTENEHLASQLLPKINTRNEREKKVVQKQLEDIAKSSANLLKELDILYNKAIADKSDEQLGVQIVARALEEPLRVIASNAGYEGSVIINKVRSESGNIGFDAKTGEFVNMIDVGIIDPAKVVRSALQNAASIAGLLLTTEALITEIPDEKKDSAHPHAADRGMGGMGMGGMPGMY